MNRLKMHSINKVDKNVKNIANLFPNCVTEAIIDDKLTRVVDFDMLKQELSDFVVEGNEERFQFTWPDKKKSILLANAPVAETLRPCCEESVDFDNTQNLYIEGDNLNVLKLLQESYLGKVKMIFIDPPYNTGNDFVYEDDFRQNADAYLEISGQFDEEGNRLFQNTESNGRFHTDWLNMIYPRLRLSKDLLSDDGVIFISIDDNEVQNLRKICDEVFGEDNFVESIVWKKRYGGGSKEKYLVSLHEYILMYCKNIESLDEIFVPLSNESINRYYTNKDEKYDLRGGYRTHPLEAGKAMDSRENLIYSIPSPDGTDILPKRQWLWSKERTFEALKNNELLITKGKNDQWVVSTKQYLKDNEGKIRQGKLFSIIDDIYTQHGTNEMINYLGNAKIFNYPKPVELIKKLLLIGANTDSTIIDFFSGSATTAHAVMKLNAEDGGNRKFIMVQLPEQTDETSEANKTGYNNICEIGKERIRRAGAKIKEEAGLSASNLDVGFRVLKLDSTNMKGVYYNPDEYEVNMFDNVVDNIKCDRTSEDLLFQVMLDLDVILSSKIEESTIDGKKVFSVADGYLITCFDEKVTEETVKTIAKQKPYYFVMRDISMADDSVAVNFEQIFATYSPDTIRRVL